MHTSLILESPIWLIEFLTVQWLTYDTCKNSSSFWRFPGIEERHLLAVLFNAEYRGSRAHHLRIWARRLKSLRERIARETGLGLY